MESKELQVTIPKPTWYNNYLFRSKLEAKWAVFFDRLKIRWTYEPEPFVCSDGSQYTPDFFLPEVYLRDVKGIYIEIKPEGFSDHLYYRRIKSSLEGSNLVVLFGDPITATVEAQDSGYNKNSQLQPWEDHPMVFMFCDSCRTAKIEFNEGNYYFCPKCKTPLLFIDPEVSSAAEFARNFRFQFYDPRNK